MNQSKRSHQKLEDFFFPQIENGGKAATVCFSNQRESEEERIKGRGNRTENQNRRSPEREKEAVAKLLAAAENNFSASNRKKVEKLLTLTAEFEQQLEKRLTWKKEN